MFSVENEGLPTHIYLAVLNTGKGNVNVRIIHCSSTTVYYLYPINIYFYKIMPNHIGINMRYYYVVDLKNALYRTTHEYVTA